MLQHNKRIRWLQGIVERWVMKVCTGFMWLMIRYGSGFCKHGKEASSTTGRKTFRYIRMTQMVQGFDPKQIKDLLIPCFNQHNALIKIQYR